MGFETVFSTEDNETDYILKQSLWDLKQIDILYRCSPTNILKQSLWDLKQLSKGHKMKQLVHFEAVPMGFETGI